MANNSGHVDLEELIKFASSINELSNTLETYFQVTAKGLTELGQTHRDRKYEEFKAKFDDDYQKLKPLSDLLAQYANHIQTTWKSAILDYLDTNMHK